MFKYKKNQSSMEFLMMFGTGLSLILVMSALFFGYFNDEKKTLDTKYIQKVGDNLMKSVEQMYYRTKGDRITINLKLPENIDNMTIEHLTTNDVNKVSYDSIVFDYIVDGRIHKLRYEPMDIGVRFNCTKCYHNNTLNISWYNQSDFSGGSRNLRIESMGDWVAVDFAHNFINTSQ